jgi:hypothetical protein
MGTSCKQTVPVAHGGVMFFVERITRLQFRYEVRTAAHTTHHAAIASAKRVAASVAALPIIGHAEVWRVQTMPDGTERRDCVWRA